MTLLDSFNLCQMVHPNISVDVRTPKKKGRLHKNRDEFFLSLQSPMKPRTLEIFKKCLSK